MRKTNLKRRSRLSPGSKGPRRGGKIKPRNAKRRTSEFARCYHSRERVAFVKSLPCLACISITPLMLLVPVRGIDNAHTEGGGAGRKAGYETIVPLCRNHHQRYDEHRAPFDRVEVRDWLKAQAPTIEAMWSRHLTREGEAA